MHPLSACPLPTPGTLSRQNPPYTRKGTVIGSLGGKEGGQAACSLLAFTPMATAETGGQEGFDATHGERSALQFKFG